jgi:NitT/TauT family transport system ATP-binding protein
MQPLITVSRLQKSYESHEGAKVLALDSVSFDIREGEFISVVGPSGCGKTTLLKILAGLVPSSSGRISINGEFPDAARRNCAVVFQSPVLLPWLTVLRNVTLPLELQQRRRAECEQEARKVLELVQLRDAAARYPSELSGGMQQRVSLARALVQAPKVLFMDEPFGALDAFTRELMNVELQRIWLERKTTVFFITHSISEALFLGDRVLVMTPQPGRVVDFLTVKLSRPRTLDSLSDPAIAELASRIRRTLRPQD